MRVGLYLANMRRESRGSRGRLVFFTLCLAVGVAAVVGVGALVGSLEAGIRGSARELLTADLVVSGRRALPAELGEFLATRPEIERTDVRQFASVVSRVSGKEAHSQLAELKVVDGRFPFYGQLKLAAPGRAPGRAPGATPEGAPDARPDGTSGATSDVALTLDDLLDAQHVVAAPELLHALRLEVGDAMLVGGQPFTIAGTVVEEPARLGFSLTLGPRLFLNAEGLERTALLGVGNRVKYLALLAIPGDPDASALSELSQAMGRAIPDAGFLRFETSHEAQPTVRRALQRVQHYLGLVALLSLLLGGTGVAQIVRAWIAERTASIAVLRCLGFRPRQVLLLYLGNVAALSLVGSTVGALLGLAVPSVFASLMPGLVPGGMESHIPWSALWQGLGLGVGVALVFSVPPLTAVWRVPPARVLRAEAAPLPAPRGLRLLSGVVLLVGVFGAAWVQSASAERAAWFSGGLAVLVVLLVFAARGLMRLTSAIPRERLHPYLKYGLAALSRPGAGTTGAVVALGLGVLVVLGLTLVQQRLGAELSSVLPEEAPTCFLTDIQPDQWPGVRAGLEQHGATAIDSVPVVMARLSALDGQTVDGSRSGRGDRSSPRNAETQGFQQGAADEDDDEGRRPSRRRGRWMFTREQRLTWMDSLPEDNRIVAGALWSDPERDELSLEAGFAEDLGVGLGSVLVFDVQGVPVELTVTSLREVEWGSFTINFFLVVEPGVLDDAPHFRIAAARMDGPDELSFQDQLVLTYPNVSMLRVKALIEKVGALLRRLGAGVRFLGAFTALAGIAILAGAAASTSLRRAREVALLKTLGVTRKGVLALLATEFALSGLTAGLMGGVGAFALAWAFLVHVADLAAELPWWTLFVAAGASALLAAVSGLLASGRALNVRPIESLRG